jgi:hypothetical protein
MGTEKEEGKDDGRAAGAAETQDAAERLAEQAAAEREQRMDQPRRHPNQPPLRGRRQQRHGVRWLDGGSLADEAADTATEPSQAPQQQRQQWPPAAGLPHESWPRPPLFRQGPKTPGRRGEAKGGVAAACLARSPGHGRRHARLPHWL